MADHPSGFNDLADFLDDTLPLPWRDKVYAVPGCDAETGLVCQQLFTAAQVAMNGGTPTQRIVLPDDRERDLFRELLGPVWDELVEDGARWPIIRHFGMTAMTWTAAGRDIAQAYWNSGGHPEAPAPNRKARRSTSTATAKASTTPRRGSTSTTPSPRTSSAKQPAKSSRGQKS